MGVGRAFAGQTGRRRSTLKKTELPVKTCVVCGLPFTWRKKWARCWDEVRYCSERCRRNKALTRP
ncbi:hypothetical protein ALP06_100485 [Pseudomonas coronafaciens pv. atropurpurea]|nr:hypothetical protein ALP06_100485 [Pseudomonas coronafaciens pv. atropurpurea]